MSAGNLVEQGSVETQLRQLWCKTRAPGCLHTFCVWEVSWGHTHMPELPWEAGHNGRVWEGWNGWSRLAPSSSMRESAFPPSVPVIFRPLSKIIQLYLSVGFNHRVFVPGQVILCTLKVAVGVGNFGSSQVWAYLKLMLHLHLTPSIIHRHSGSRRPLSLFALALTLPLVEPHHLMNWILKQHKNLILGKAQMLGAESVIPGYRTDSNGEVIFQPFSQTGFDLLLPVLFTWPNKGKYVQILM